MTLIEFFKEEPVKNEIVSAIEDELDIDYSKIKFDDLWQAFIYATKSDDFMLPEKYISFVKENFDDEVTSKIHEFLKQIEVFLTESDAADFEYQFAILTFEIETIFDAKKHGEERKQLLSIIKSIDYRKFEAGTENLITILTTNEEGFSECLVFLEERDSLGEKETTILSYLAASGIKSEGYYKFLRSICKKDENEAVLEIILNCVEDYGDVRAVSFLRTLAKKYYDKIEDAVASDNNAKKYQDIFYMILGVIESLGGNTEL